MSSNINVSYTILIQHLNYGEHGREIYTCKTQVASLYNLSDTCWEHKSYAASFASLHKHIIGSIGTSGQFGQYGLTRCCTRFHAPLL